MSEKPKVILDLERRLDVEIKEYNLNFFDEIIVLDLSAKNLKNILPLTELRQLMILKLENNFITDLSPLADLLKLEILNLENNQIYDVSYLQNLSNITKLNLNKNFISDISSLSNLNELRVLSLNNNCIEDISHISSLEWLETFDVRNNLIREIPKDFLRKRSLNIIYEDKRILFSQNYFGNPLDIGIINAIKNDQLFKYLESRERGTIKIPEAKMVLLGEPRAGKTTLQKYLMGLPIDENEESTLDIQISSWKPFVADDVDDYTQNIKINLWDFGGQEIQYSLHKLFMTDDTLYIIVLDSTKDQSPTQYLKFLESYAPNSSFIIINNHGDISTNNTFKLDENYLHENYAGEEGKPVLKGIFRRVSVTKAAKFDPQFHKIMNEVEATIKKELLLLKNLNKDFPKEYESVKTAIEVEYSKPDRHYITMTYYHEMCKCLKITDDEDLRKAILAYLNEIGVLRYFKDTPTAYHILNPKWLIDGAYSLIMDELTGMNQGVLTKKEACGILKRSRKGFNFKENEAEFIFTTMKYYGLLYADETEQKVYIPLKFSSLQPAKLTDFYEKGKHFYFEFESDIPEEIIAYLIVKHFEEITGRLYWSKGAIFEKGGVRILSKVEDRRIHFYIQGQFHQLYFESLRATLLKKLKTLGGLRYEEKVEFKYEKKQIIAKYDDLITVIKDDWTDYYPDFATKTKVHRSEISKILGAYFSKEQVQPQGSQYIIYGNYNDNRFQQITIIQRELNQLVQSTKNEGDRKALEAIRSEIQLLRQTRKTDRKESLGRKLFGKIKQLSTDTADDAVKDKLKDLFPKVIDKGIDWIEKVDFDGIMRIFGGIL